MEIGIDEVRIGTEMDGAWTIIVEIGIVVVGWVCERFIIGSLSTLSKMSCSFGVWGWFGRTTWEEVGVDTWGGTKVGINSEMNFWTCELSAMSYSLWILYPQTLIVRSYESSSTTACLDFFDFVLRCFFAFLGDASIKSVLPLCLTPIRFEISPASKIAFKSSGIGLWPKARIFLYFSIMKLLEGTPKKHNLQNRSNECEILGICSNKSSVLHFGDLFDDCINHYRHFVVI